MNKNLALFDFDGTLTRKDSLLEFIKFYHGQTSFKRGFLRHTNWLVAMKLGLATRARVKERILIHFFKGETVKKFKERATVFSLTTLPKLVRKDALAQLKKHQENGDRVVIISASAEDWLMPWCKAHGLELLATKLNKKEGQITGEISGLNCSGYEKVRRIKELIHLKEYKNIYAYGDSQGDKEMLELSTHSFYKRFQG